MTKIINEDLLNTWNHKHFFSMVEFSTTFCLLVTIMVVILPAMVHGIISCTSVFILFSDIMGKRVSIALNALLSEKSH